MEQKKQTKKTERKKVAEAMQLTAPTRGRSFEGKVVKIFPHRVVVEFSRVVKVKKYERFYKKKTKLHARIPKEINLLIGDYVRVMECRPLSKIIHFIVVEKIRSNQEEKNESN
jgi:small subunit ribosomal protein S17